VSAVFQRYRFDVILRCEPLRASKDAVQHS
jgi:hypothetical protein